MKHIYLIPVTVIIIILSGCGAGSKADPLRLYIPGVYARKVVNEFSIGNDTLVIARLSRQGNSYQIVQRSSYRRIQNGKPQKIESKVENWTAVYNEQEKLLHETKKGKLISFNPEQGALMVGSSEYKKVE